MNKDELRSMFKIIRANVYDKELKSEIISKKIIESDFYKDAKVVALYSSISCEVDTSTLINNSILIGKTVVLPKVTDNGGLKFYRIHSLNDIIEGKFFGIKEPREKSENLIDKSDIDLIIVPGICFDNYKNRIGFGKGYYDRYLDGAYNIIKVGICFDEQLIKNENIPLSKFDVKMDFVITDKTTL